jgi:hypothetical protein
VPGYLISLFCTSQHHFCVFLIEACASLMQIALQLGGPLSNLTALDPMTGARVRENSVYSARSPKHPEGQPLNVGLYGNLRTRSQSGQLAAASRKGDPKRVTSRPAYPARPGQPATPETTSVRLYAAKSGQATPIRVEVGANSVCLCVQVCAGVCVGVAWGGGGPPRSSYFRTMHHQPRFQLMINVCVWPRAWTSRITSRSLRLAASST